MRSVRLRRSATGGLALGLVAVLVGCAAEPSPEVAVRGFLLDWQDGNYAAAAERTTGESEEVAEALRSAHDQLDLAALRLGLAPIERDGHAANAGFEAQADLGIGDPVWSYLGEMDMQRMDGEWLVDWAPSVIHPQLRADERLAVTYNVAERGQILDRDREALIDDTEVSAVGVRAVDMPDLDDGVAELAELLDDDSERLLDRVRSAPPEEFQPLALHRAEEVERGQIRDAEDIDGVEVHEINMPLAPAVAPALLGDVAGTQEHNIADRVSGPYQAGDTVGLNGLQSGYQQELGGTATTRVVALDGEDAEERALQEWPGESSSSLTTTLDRQVQEAAEGALATEPLTSHLVAVDISTGELRAAASQPRSSENTGALTGEYLPGEAFTVVTAAALLSSGVVAPDDTVSCPSEVTIGGETFGNPSGVTPGERTVADQFAQGCTTAFAQLAEELSGEQLADAAASFGIGAEFPFPVEAFPGQVGQPEDVDEVAGTAVGQAPGSATVSPLNMAHAAAAVAEGAYTAPELLDQTGAASDGDGENGANSEDGTTESDLAELPDAVATDLQDMMAGPVAEGPASGLGGVAGEPVHGQAGAAQQSVDGEDRVVQWFLGYQDGLAFATATELPPEFVAGNEHQYAVGFTVDFLQRMPR